MKTAVRAVALAGLAAACALGAVAQDARRNVWDGVYSEAQADRGERAYERFCVACHAQGMRGGAGAPPLVGPAFLFNWSDKTLGALFEQVRTTMPPGQVGVVSDEEFADALAAVLRANGFPAANAQTEMPPDADALETILILRSSPDG